MTELNSTPEMDMPEESKVTDPVPGSGVEEGALDEALDGRRTPGAVRR